MCDLTWVTNESNILKRNQWFWNHVCFIYYIISYKIRIVWSQGNAPLTVHFVLTITKSLIIIICIQYYIINTSFSSVPTYLYIIEIIIYFLKIYLFYNFERCGLIWHNVLRTITLLRTTQWPCLHYNMCKQTYIEINHVHLSITCFSYLCLPNYPGFLNLKCVILLAHLARLPEGREPKCNCLHSSIAH